MSPSMLDLDSLVKSLPACKRCRECRRGCDTLLPKCSYISELVDHVRRISPQGCLPSPAASSDTPQTNSSVSIIKQETQSSSLPQFEHHFAYAGDSYRYLGSESCLLKSPRLHANIPPPFKYDKDDEEWQLATKDSPAKQWELLELFKQTIQPVYPVLDMKSRYLAADLPADLTHTELFSLYMIYSISCYILPNTGNRRDKQQTWNPTGRLSYHQANSIKYRALATQYFTRAMEYLEAATMEPTIATLRSVLLLAINSSFDPKTGNIGQQVALAARLAFDLESKRELQELDEYDVELLRSMHMTIYSLENQNCEILFDRAKPAEYMCSLFRLQNRFRSGDAATKEQVKKLLPLLDEFHQHLPIVRIVLHMTHLLLNPVWGSAWYVLEAVVSLGGIHVFVTPQWVYRAGTVLIQNMPAILGGNLIQLYSNALLVLELSSWKWPSSAALAASLVDLMQNMKLKYRPEWSDTLQSGDVRI
ncbi:hypothetical protein LEMA_P105820.1 [Plenodomus lingam JN3]|uniref:Transcription factor domain-containing protein n=1 Tax=Leptosphaeria maculans (strain JN3 / isolate v23.1.3 / race Av1-4-5-6-7-8) TaxID=985895 RepID=E5A1I7_LEPMJ|nr:hypothetical protein LEMA_P105820.1 [Plenodomus lingam JN3]CBX97451.1 hypothetical protein LEMA_P105820.1 [Plenodomus lingam JN3]